MCSDEFRWFLGGWMMHTPELMVFYAPNVNSYKDIVLVVGLPLKLHGTCALHLKMHEL
jgi:hypothetical protein